MSMPEIEKGVPLPPNYRRGRVYPFADMEIGDSFFGAGGSESRECPKRSNSIRKDQGAETLLLRPCRRRRARSCLAHGSR